MCPLTLDSMQDPVMTRWGHNFERMALLTWLQRHDECPLTRNPMTLQDIIGNRALKEKIHAWRKMTGSGHDQSEETTSDSSSCSANNKTTLLFVLAKSSKTVIRALEDHEDPTAKSVLKIFKKERREVKRRQRAAAATAA
jgi:hypothetical protein